MAKCTPLFEFYSHDPNVKIVDFSGWELPLHFGHGILHEHHMVRSGVGMFDVSHMGEIEVSGPDSQKFLNYLLTNDIDRLKIGRCLYSPMCNHEGGTVDDLLVYRFGESVFILVVNAGNRDTDFAWIVDQARTQSSYKDVKIRDLSDETALIALQGPSSVDILSKVILNSATVENMRRFGFLTNVMISGIPCTVSRTGYTGEDGFELYTSAGDAQKVWQALLDMEVIPCGLGARDTLRFEACLPLYGHELRTDISPLETGLGFAVKLAKDDFVGREALKAERRVGSKRRLVGVKMIDRGVPRQGYTVLREKKPVGEVTSGMKAPSLNAFLALVLLDNSCGDIGESLGVDINGHVRTAQIIETPFYRRS